MELTDAECDAIAIELAKDGDFCTRECIRFVHKMTESGEFDGFDYCAEFAKGFDV